MPEKREESGLIAGLGDQVVEAFNAGKSAPIDLKFGGQLPAGIENGVAQLRDLKIGKFADGTKHAGKPYFMAQAVAVSPKELKGARVAGLFTRIGPEPLCDTPEKTGESSRKTFAQHFKYMLDILRQLGWNPAEIQGKTSQEVETILLAAFKALCKVGPYFRFRTWKGKKQVIARDTDGKLYLFEEDDSGNKKRLPGKGPYQSEQIAKFKNPYAGSDPMVQHVWGEVLHDYHVSTGNGVQDDTGETEPAYNHTNRISEHMEEAGDSGGAIGGENDQPAKSGSFDEFGGLDDLVQRAYDKDDKAQDDLQNQAIAAGWNEDDVIAAEDWSAVAEMIRSPKNQESDEPEDEGTQDTESEPKSPAPPAVKDLVSYRPIDKKTKKPANKAVECEIVAVDKKTKKVNLKSLRDGKTIYKDVGWDQLAS